MPDGQIDPTLIDSILQDFADPETGRGLKPMGQVVDVSIDGDRVELTIGLTTYSAPLWDDTRERLTDQLQAKLAGKAKVHVKVVEHDRPAEPIGGIGLTAKSVIAVGSGKGGVGKSTIAASLALGLKRAGAKVGLMDADVYGPSIPHLLGVDEKPTATAEKRLQPIVSDGLKVMSMGFLVPPDEAVIWRGPMLHGAITQFLRDTDWGNLDYLIIDMPPGTGDIALTLSQLLPLTGAVVVCTPQDVALLDAVKAVAMVPQGEYPTAGNRREHELLPLPRQRQTLRHLRLRWRATKVRGSRRSIPGRSTDSHRDPRARRRGRDRRQLHRPRICPVLRAYLFQLGQKYRKFQSGRSAHAEPVGAIAHDLWKTCRQVANGICPAAWLIRRPSSQ